MRKATEEKRRFVLENRRRRTRRDLAKLTGLSLGTVQAIVAEGEADERSRRAPAPPAVTEPPDPAPDALIDSAAALADELGDVLDQIIAREVDRILGELPACPACKLPTLPGSPPCEVTSNGCQ